VRYVLGEPEAKWVFGALQRSTNKLKEIQQLKTAVWG